MKATINRRGPWPSTRLAVAGVAALVLVCAAPVAAGYLAQRDGGSHPGPRSSGAVRIEPAAIVATRSVANVVAPAPDVAPAVARAAPAGPDLAVASAAPADLVATAAPTQDDGGSRLQIPYRSQFDGSTFEWGNCGVSAISMAMEHYGHPFATHDVRLAINQMTGNWDTKIGVDWRYLKLALEQRGFAVDGPYAESAGYRTWTLEEVLAQVDKGRPAMLLVHYRSLPGHEEDEWIGDHYILVLGETRDGEIVYHDPGFPGERGAFMSIDRARLERAWSNTWIGQNRTAMVILPPD